MKVLLVYPPQAQPFMPHPAVPIITSILQAEGVEVVQKDLNLQAYLHFLSPPVLEGLGMRPDFAANSAVELDAIRTGEEFFNPAVYFRAVGFLQNCLTFVSGKFPGLTWNLKSFAMQGYSTGSWDDIVRATTDSKTNLFVDYFESIMPEIVAENPQLIGISVAWDAQLIPTFTLARLIKKYLPNTHICLGGSMISHLVDYIKGMPQIFSLIDSVLPYQGETGIVALTEAVVGTNTLDNVPGLMYRVDGAVRTNSTCTTKKMVLPIPNFDQLPLKQYLSPRVYLPLVASRGCYYAKCAFCSHHLSGTSFRSRRVDEVLEEMDILKEKYGCDDFYFSDDSLPPALGIKLANQISEKQKPYRWMAELRFEKMMNLEYFKSLYAGGARVLLFGLESGSDRVADLMEKGTRKAHAAQMLEACSKAGIVTWVFFFLGFPGETEEEANETLDFLVDQRKNIDMIAGGPFVLTRNSPIFSNPEKFAVTEIHKNERLDLQLAYDYTIDDTKGYKWDTRKVLEQYRQRPETRKFMRPFVVEPHLLYFKKKSFNAHGAL